MITFFYSVLVFMNASNVTNVMLLLINVILYEVLLRPSLHFYRHLCQLKLPTTLILDLYTSFYVD